MPPPSRKLEQYTQRPLHVPPLMAAKLPWIVGIDLAPFYSRHIVGHGEHRQSEFAAALEVDTFARLRVLPPKSLAISSSSSRHGLRSVQLDSSTLKGI